MANGYDDGKPPTFKKPNPYAKNQGGRDADIFPPDKSWVADRPYRPTGAVEAPVARGGGLFKAKGCVPGKNGM
jgi:hypothetical protein